MGTPTPTTVHEEATQSNHEKEKKDVTLREFIDVDNAILRKDLPFLKTYVNGTETSDVRRVNLSGDPLLNVMINYGSKNELLLDLIKMMTAENLEATNMVGDTALHVAAANNNLLVVTALISKNSNLIEKRNKKHETPLLKAALSGSAFTFRKLVKCGSNIFCRAKLGDNVLHYAILGNNPELALEIAQQCKTLLYARNSKALTPLQLLVTIPEAFRSKLELGPAESFIYTFIQLNSHDGESKETERNRDEEELGESISKNHWVESNAERDKLLKKSVTVSSKKFMQKYQLTWYLFYVANLIGNYLDASHVRFYIISVLKKMFKRVEELEILKKNHIQTMKLVEYLAKDEMYWDFIRMGSSEQKQTGTVSGDDGREDFMHDDVDVSEKKFLIKEFLKVTESVVEKCIGEPTRWPELLHKVIKELMELTDSLPKEPIRGATRWTESPLIVGAKMGLHDFVEQILKVRPQSVQIKDSEGRNVLQVAIKHGHVKIVKLIAGMISGPNPTLPSWLLWDNEDDSMNNTILHYAAEITIKSEGVALQMQREIKWFEMVKELLPEDLVNTRNIKEETAQELFDKNHEEMVKSGRNQLMEIGKTCSSLLAAVVFATSFSIPASKDSDSRTGPSNNNVTNSSEGNHFQDESVGFIVFSHVYVIGLSCATCSLLLFLSLLISNYSLESFRRALPTKFILAIVSFLLALSALLVAFICNVYLSIYGGGTPKPEDLLPLILELTGFPFLCVIAWFLGGFGIPFSNVILSKFRR